MSKCNGLIPYTVLLVRGVRLEWWCREHKVGWDRHEDEANPGICPVATAEVRVAELEARARELEARSRELRLEVLLPAHGFPAALPPGREIVTLRGDPVSRIVDVPGVEGRGPRIYCQGDE